MEDSNVSRGQNANRHPPHLRGRAIGLWYAQRQQQRSANSQPVATIEFSPNEIQRFTEVRHLFKHQQYSQRAKPDFSSNYDDDRDENFEIDDREHAIHFERLQNSFQYFEPLNSQPEIDQNLVNDLRQKQNSSLYKNLFDQRAHLPISKYHQEILDTIQHNQIFILVGETGSGILICSKYSFDSNDHLFKEKQLKQLNIFSIRKFSIITVANVE